MFQASKLAPLGKSGLSGKSSGSVAKSKPTASSSSKSSNVLGGSKSGSASGSIGNKSYLSPNYSSVSKSSKPSSSFGVIWIPTKRHGRHKKEKVYNPIHNERRRERSPSMYQLNYEKPIVETSSPHQTSAGVAVGTAATVTVDPLNIVNPNENEEKIDNDKESENPAVLSITTEPKQLLGKDVCDRAVGNAATLGNVATFDEVPLLGPPKQEEGSMMNEDNKKETLNPTPMKKEKENCFTTSLSCCIDTLDCTIM